MYLFKKIVYSLLLVPILIFGQTNHLNESTHEGLRPLGLGFGFGYSTVSNDLHFNFSYPNRNSLISDGWDFIAITPSGSSRDTEQTSGAVVSYDQQVHPGVLRIPVDVGDLWEGINSTRNTLFRGLPSGWTSIRLNIASFNPVLPYQQAGLLVYENDNNYVQLTRIFNGSNLIVFVREVNGVASVLNSVSESSTTNLHFRLDRNQSTGNITSYYSLNNNDWVLVGEVAQSFNNLRFAVVVCASPGGFPNADIAWAEVKL